MRTTIRSTAGDAGFTLVELLIAMGIVLAVMGGALTVLNDGYRFAESATGIIGLNNNLRIGVDLLVRDLIQVGQGLPPGADGPGAERRRRVADPAAPPRRAARAPSGRPAPCPSRPSRRGRDAVPW